MYRRSMGGIGRYSQELLKHLVPLAQDFEIVVFLTPEDLKEWNLEASNLRVVETNIYHYTLDEQIKLGAVLEKQKLDLVHFLNFNHPLNYRGRFVVTLHDLTLLLFPGHGSKKASFVKQTLFKKVFMHALNRSERIISISEYTAEDANTRLGIDKKKMDVVYEGGPEPVPSSFFDKDQRDLLTSFLKSDQPFFVFVSNWRPHKGLVTLVAAFNKFKDETKLPHNLVIVGNPEAAPPGVQEALETSPYRKDIITPGFAPEELLPHLFHFSEAFVFPSEYEGFGLPVLEAYAYSVPVIAANNSSLPEVVGEAGLLFETRDVNELARKLAEVALIPSVRRALVEKIPEQRSRFSWDRCARQTLDVYRSVLESTKQN